MNRNPLRTLVFGSCLLGLSVSGMAKATPEFPQLPGKLAKQLKKLPYGSSGQSSLFLRGKHVDGIQFFAAGTGSQDGFLKKGGLAKNNLWLRLKNSGGASHAFGWISFKKPLNAERYGSIVMWVRSNKKGQRLSLGFQDDRDEDSNVSQASTPGFPKRGLPKGKIVQLAVPFSAITSKGDFKYSKLTRLGFEFGKKKTRNSRGAEIEVFGLAFVEQEKTLAAIKLGSLDKPEKKRGPITVKKNRKKTIGKTARKTLMPARSEATQTPSQISKATTTKIVKKVVPQETKARKVIKPPAIPKKTPPVKPIRTVKKKTQPSHSPLLALTKWFFISKNGVLGPYPPFVDFVFFPLILLLSVMVFQKRKKFTGHRLLGKVLWEIGWPLPTSEWENNPKLNRLFWRKQATDGKKHVWLSGNHTQWKKNGTEDFLGEHFLTRQTQLANREGVSVIPSLGLVRTVFHYDTFLAHPHLFMTRRLTPVEHHLSDEELRVKYIGYFPVWIPPFWQKKHGLSQRVLVAYGKMPGAIFASDSVQYNLTSPHLRQSAIRILKSFADQTSGVRIEGASSLLNSSIEHYWADQVDTKSLSDAPEFWEEVIAAVKKDHPRFMFIADGVGLDMESMARVGFDFFENDRLREIMINQIRLETMGNLKDVLGHRYTGHLHRSLFNIANLLNASPVQSSSRCQNLMCAVLLTLLPGRVTFHDSSSPEFNGFFKASRKWPALKSGEFMLVETTKPSILAFARWTGKNFMIVAANFSTLPQTTELNMYPFRDGFNPKNLYLFSDVLHGTSILNSIKDGHAKSPAIPTLGDDLRDSGFPIKLSGLSLKVISVNLSHTLTPDRVASREAVFQS